MGVEDAVKRLALASAVIYLAVLVTGFIEPRYAAPLYLKLVLAVPVLVYASMQLLVALPTYYSLTPLVVFAVSVYWTMLMVFGLLQGFTLNASAPTALTSLINILVFTPILLSRAFTPIVLAGGRGRALVLAAAIAFQVLPLVTVPELLRSLSSLRSLMVVVVQELLPALAAGIAIAMLALLREYRAIVVLVLGLQLPYYALPVLPNINPWLLASITIAVAATLSLLLTVSMHRLSSMLVRGRRQWSLGGVRDTLITIAMGIVLVLLITTGYRPLVIVSNSMSPTIERGDVVVVAPLGGEEPEIGDIIAYYREGYGIVVHRVVEVRETQTGIIIVTKGDANTVEDEPINTRSIVGRVVLIIPSIGKASLTLRSLIHSIQEAIGGPS